MAVSQKTDAVYAFNICCLHFYVELLSTVVILVLHQMDTNMAHDIGRVNLCHSFVIHNITWLVQLLGRVYPLVTGVEHSLHVRNPILILKKWPCTQASSRAMASFSIISRNFWSKRLVLIRLGSCVTVPPFTAGQQVRFTVSVMGRHTLLRWSGKVHSCLEDIQILLGVRI